MIPLKQQRVTPQRDRNAPAWLHDLVIRCLSEDPKQRPEAQEVFDELSLRLEELGRQNRQKGYITVVHRNVLPPLLDDQPEPKEKEKEGI